MSDNNPYFLNNYTFRPEFCTNSFNNAFMPVPSQYFSIPPPPLMPPMPGLNQNQHHKQISDQDFVRQFEKLIPKTTQPSMQKSVSINEAKTNLQTLLTALNEAKDKQAYLKQNMETLDDEEWMKNHQEILNNKALIENLMMRINDTYLNMMNKALIKRAAKRSRLKRVKMERQIEKQELLKKRQEKSRSIDESLQKIVDDLAKIKEEEKSKIQADTVLKEVLRKKLDAKKYLTKLDALLKLHKARLNTAKGRGVAVSDNATSKFNEHIEKLSLLWTKKLAAYEREETDLREKLKTEINPTEKDINKKEMEVDNNLKAWRQFLFGDADGVPQRDFGGDLRRFVEVRSDWDQYASEDGTTLPIGWVLPE